MAGEHSPRPEPSANGADGSDAIQWVTAFLPRRRQLLVRLDRVNAALARWDEAEAAARLPATLRRPGRRPVLPRSSLEGLRAMLVEELGRLEGGPEG